MRSIKKSKRRSPERFSTHTDVDAKRNPRVIHRKLGREGNWGEQWPGTSLIYLDPRMRSQRYLNTLIHEMLHLFFPELNERTVRVLADKMAKEIWQRRYRRLDK
jgi:hypothetical protein